MKFTVIQPVEIDVSAVFIELPVRYDEEQIPNDFPLRIGNKWVAKVTIDNGQIQDWPGGEPRRLNLKVTDSGRYTLLNHANEMIGETRADYVPHGLIPGSYGDYVELEIDANGYITNWPKTPDVSAFFGDED